MGLGVAGPGSVECFPKAQSMKRVVSMVPSWTETLLWAGVEVVGRTRFCIHPSEMVGSIPKVGGTKDWNLAKVRALQPDLLILDREENPLEMSLHPELPFWAGHIVGIESLPAALSELSVLLDSELLESLAARWGRIADSTPELVRVEDLPGVLEWGRRPIEPVGSVVYVIWKDPWMAVGPETFIASVLSQLGLKLYPFQQKYPRIDLGELPADTLLLFSSEPFPFLRKREGLDELGFPYAFVDGECFSWFGVRSLEFLESASLSAGNR